MIVAEWMCDIVCLCETWLSPELPNSLFSISGFSLFRRDRFHDKHGGLLIFVSTHLSPTRRIDLEDIDIECIVLELTLLSCGPCLLYFCYRPPSYSPEIYFDRLSSSLSNSSADVIILLGDFNAKHQQWTSAPPNSAGNRLVALLQDFCLTQCVHEPTRYSSDGHTSSTLDLLATNRPELIETITVSDPISDHCRVTAKLRTSTAHPKRTSFQVYNYELTDWEKLHASLSSAPLLEAIQGTEDVNIAYRVWHDLFMECIYRHVPRTTVTIRPGNKKWMTSYLHKLSKKKHRLFRRHRVSPSPETWSSYTAFRNFCNNEFRKAKQQYLHRAHVQLESESDGSYYWWRKVKQLSRISQPQSPVPELSWNNKSASTDTTKANLLASFFSLQCSHSNSDLPDRQDHDSAIAPYPWPENLRLFEFPYIEENTVLQLLRQLPKFKSSGASPITNRLLRESAPQIVASITYLFNLSLRTCQFPTVWKIATVIPLYKHRGSRNDPSNYRPVSLLPAIGKILDHIQSVALTNYLTKHRLLSDHQFGFLAFRSSTLQLAYLIDKWLLTLERRQGVLTCFMDFQKAFDKVWHSGLLLKLGGYGMHPNALAWLRDYLSDRSLIVKVNSTLSDKRLVTAGVPQGSHLGPILFLIFINDLPETIMSPVETDLYADDALLHTTYRRTTISSNVRCLQTAVSSAASWATEWRGRFSPAKTIAMPIGRPAVTASTLTITLERLRVETTTTHKHLGIILSSDLRWSPHMEKIIANASQRAGLLRVMSKDLPLSVSSKLYTYYVRPVLEYCSPVWHGSVSDQHALALERIQAGVARAILKAPWSTTKSRLLEELGWPSLRWRRSVATVCLLHSLLTNTKNLPRPVLNSLPKTVSEKSRYNHRKPLQLLLPHTHTSRYLRSFFPYASLLWNSLPHTIQSIHSQSLFKSAVEELWSPLKFNTTTDIPF